MSQVNLPVQINQQFADAKTYSCNNQQGIRYKYFRCGVCGKFVANGERFETVFSEDGYFMESDNQYVQHHKTCNPLIAIK